ncbi:MAG TPA: glycosyltransferase family 39 protein [Candidatus Acidoferrales bacterium]|nr:glycosyltransferase family 39 protein [Candidatus Acidoferrales bacterium]
MTRAPGFALALIVLLGLALRVYHVHNPILDHPAWRQGDEAAIARNFLELNNNIFYPQTDYDGPPPNYVELELQLVPYAAAQLYRLFGVHEIFARLIVIALSVTTIPLIYALGTAIYSRRAGLIAALLFAIAPGAVYYGRAIIPESGMIFFSVAALLFWWRWIDSRRLLDFSLAGACAMLACLAKPPALLILGPMLALWFVRVRSLRGFSPYALIALCVVPLWLYLGHLNRIAEWHWATGITQRHVIPTLVAELTSPPHLIAGLQSTLALSKMLTTTILGPVIFGMLLLCAFLQPPDEERPGRSIFFGTWIALLIVYTFAVVNVERVDYYLMPFVPFAVLYVGGGLDCLLSIVAPQGLRPRTIASLVVAAFLTMYINMLEVHPYYTWSREVYSAAGEVRRALEPNTLIVMGHYDPSVLYTIGHRGWEEDPMLWSVRDMTSAIAKGARYFVAVEVPRLKANKDIYKFMQRYERLPIHSGWQVYDVTRLRKANVKVKRI